MIAEVNKDVSLIKNKIKTALGTTRKVIDAVFISHFHEDHINGLDYLLSHYTVKKLFLPLLTEIEKIQLLIHFESQGGTSRFVSRLIENPSIAVADFPNLELVLVPPLIGKDFDDDFFDKD